MTVKAQLICFAYEECVGWPPSLDQWMLHWTWMRNLPVRVPGIVWHARVHPPPPHCPPDSAQAPRLWHVPTNEGACFQSRLTNGQKQSERGEPDSRLSSYHLLICLSIYHPSPNLPIHPSFYLPIYQSTHIPPHTSIYRLPSIFRQLIIHL